MIKQVNQPVLIRQLRHCLTAHGERIALITPGRRGAPHSTLTYRELSRDSAALALALRARGLRKGDRCALIAGNSRGWLLADLALLSLGVIEVPRGEEAPADEIATILKHAGARMVLLGHPGLLDKIPRHLDLQIGLLEGKPPGPAIFTLEDLLAERVRQRIDHERVVREEADGLQPQDPAAIVYTSGTTGCPKGVILTHGNLGANLEQLHEVIGFLQHGDTYLSLLPTWHAFERIVEYAMLRLGGTIVYTDRRHLRDDLRAWRPHAFAAVPRVWMMLRDGILAAIEKLPSARRWCARAAIALALARARDLSVWHGKDARLPRRALARSRGTALAPLHSLARRMVLQPILVQAGLERLCRGAAVSGGGTLPLHVDEFFAGLSVRLLNGYGLTETSPVIALRLPQANHLGTVGRELPGTELRLVSDQGSPSPAGQPGHIQVRGPQVMSGYWGDEKATTSVLDRDGWFDTGDLGRFTPLGDLVIAGRHKDTIVLLNGENIEPERIENTLVESPFIRQAMVVGQDRKQLAALIVAEPGVSRERLDELLRSEIDRRISTRNGFKPHERIRSFAVLENEFTVEDGTLSATMKLRRQRIRELHAEQIAALFRETVS